MRSFGLIATMSLLLGACGGGDEAPVAPAKGARRAPSPPASPPEDATASDWELRSSGEGTALAFLPEPERAAIRLYCPSGAGRLLVNVPAFQPIGSEERLSFGSGGEAAALVADSRGDSERGGVSGASEIPRNLPALIGGPMSVSYGAQNSGPHPAPPPELARAFVAACRERSAGAPPPPAATSANPCMMQGSERLRPRPLRAIGTEPFWGARIEGRCVTYSHPEDQEGTRIWTRYAASPRGESWTGALGGRRFELRTRPQPGCSDGMSDRRYPIAVELLVNGEQRRGCAEAL